MNLIQKTKLIKLYIEVSEKLNTAIQNKKSIIVQNSFEKKLLQIQQQLENR
tara:strand:+ start:816 stop:968 length:153 start_codon:yes stop_codon:yes gene_type:complete